MLLPNLLRDGADVRIHKDDETVPRYDLSELRDELVQNHAVEIVAQVVEPIFVFTQRLPAPLRPQGVHYDMSDAVVATVEIAKPDNECLAQAHTPFYSETDKETASCLLVCLPSRIVQVLG